MTDGTLKIIAFVLIVMGMYNILDTINHKITIKKSVGRFLFVGFFGILYILGSLWLLGYMFG